MMPNAAMGTSNPRSRAASTVKLLVKTRSASCRTHSGSKDLLCGKLRRRTWCCSDQSLQGNQPEIIAKSGRKIMDLEQAMIVKRNMTTLQLQQRQTRISSRHRVFSTCTEKQELQRNRRALQEEQLRAQLNEKVETPTSANSDGEQLKSYATNLDQHPEERKSQLSSQGVVEGVWVVHRHGDRAPCIPLCDDSLVSDEADFWDARLPPEGLTDALSLHFPLQVHPSNGPTPLDVHRYPFGALTELGARQMLTVGRSFRDRYDSGTLVNNNHDTDHTTPDEISGDVIAKRRRRRRDQLAQEFLRDWQVTAYSTHYNRTVNSVRCFLHGLLHADQDGVLLEDDALNGKENGEEALDWNDPRRRKSHRAGGVPLSPCFSTYVSPVTGKDALDNKELINNDHAADSQAHIPICVRAKHSDPLNAFDRDWHLMMKLVRDVVSNEDFQRRDAKAAPLAARLANNLPGLISRGSRSKFGGPSGINWVHAADHFVCRSAHGVSFTEKLKGPEEGDECHYYYDADEEEQGGKTMNRKNATKRMGLNPATGTMDTMEELLTPTVAHLSWRFGQWYGSAPLLAEFAGPPLREIVRQIKDCASETCTGTSHIENDGASSEVDEESGSWQKKPFVLYSAHDVTVLSLLHGIGAELVVGEHDTRYWPPYATTLVFELVRMENDTGHIEHFVRILLNGKPVHVKAAKFHDETLLSIGQFNDLVEAMVSRGQAGIEKVKQEGDEGE